MKVFTLKELSEYDGRYGIIYVACDGNVYDVTDSPQWRYGYHQSMHRSGMDLTDEMKRAPHGVELLKTFPLIGVLKSRDKGG